MSAEFVDISSLAAFLKMQKGHSPLLILGSRTGAFFRSQDLQTVTTLFSMHGLGLASLSLEERFKESYTLLTQDLFKPDEIDTILTASLKNVDVTENDLLLGEIVKQGWFDTLISTNLDTLLEQVLADVGMRELRDFDVFCPRPDVQKGVPRSKKMFPCKIIKIFGELRTGEYIIKRDGYLTSNPMLETFLENELRNDIVAFGLDPAWDAEIIRVLPSLGGTIWLVGNKDRDKDSVVDPAKFHRDVKYVLHTGDDYKDCIRKLYDNLIGEVISPAHVNIEEDVLACKESDARGREVSSLPPLTDGIQVTNEDLLGILNDVRSTSLKILILSTVADIQWFDALHTHLRLLLMQKIIGACDHRLVMSGMEARREIDTRLRDTAIVLPLISIDFLAIYVGSAELQYLLELYDAGKLRIIPIIIREVTLMGTEFEKFAPLPDDRIPVTLWENRDSALVNVVKGIRKVIDELSPDA